MIATTLAEDTVYLEAIAEREVASLVPGLMLKTRVASAITPKAVNWLYPGRIPYGMLSLLAGYGGSGKSTVSLQWATAVSTGGTFPDGTPAPLGNVLYLAAEDSAEHTLIPRLRAMGADLSRIHIADGIRRAGTEDPDWISIREHVGHLEAAITTLGINFLVIDPISSYIGDANADRESDVRAALEPLGAMADRTGCAVLMIRHVSKGGTSTRAASRILGSTAWHDRPRVVMMLGDAPEEHQPAPNADGTRDVRRVLGVVKNNLAARLAPLTFVQMVNGAIQWESTEAPCSIDDCFSPTIPERSPRLEGAEQWVQSYLAGGSKPAATIYADAQGDGHSEKTIRRALKALGAISFQLPGKVAGGWHWRLPNGSPTTSLSSVASFGHLDSTTSEGQLTESDPSNGLYSEEL